MTTAVLDACVLYSAPLRDLWMNLAVQFVFQPKWTALIQDEWMRNVLKNRPDLNPIDLDRTKALMERWGRAWEVPEYEPLVPSLKLPDPDDRHVLAAAIASNASVIHLIGIPVTNLSVNPARSTATAVVVGGWALTQLWMFWVAPLVGAVLAGFAYKALAGIEPPLLEEVKQQVIQEQYEKAS